MLKQFLPLLILSFFFIGSLQAQDTGLKSLFGQTIPDVTIKSMTGQNKNIKDYASNGKITVFSFWATWCIPCKKELDNIAEMYEDWQDLYDVEVIAVSIDNARSMEMVKSTVNTNDWPFEVLLDPNEDLKRALNFQAVPHTVVLDKAGGVGYTHSGYVEGDEYILEEEIEKMNK